MRGFASFTMFCLALFWGTALSQNYRTGYHSSAEVFEDLADGAIDSSEADLVLDFLENPVSWEKDGFDRLIGVPGLNDDELEGFAEWVAGGKALEKHPKFDRIRALVRSPLVSRFRVGVNAYPRWRRENDFYKRYRALAGGSNWTFRWEGSHDTVGGRCRQRSLSCRFQDLRFRMGNARPFFGRGLITGGVMPRSFAPVPVANFVESLRYPQSSQSDGLLASLHGSPLEIFAYGFAAGMDASVPYFLGVAGEWEKKGGRQLGIQIQSAPERKWGAAGVFGKLRFSRVRCFGEIAITREFLPAWILGVSGRAGWAHQVRVYHYPRQIGFPMGRPYRRGGQGLWTQNGEEPLKISAGPEEGFLAVTQWSTGRMVMQGWQFPGSGEPNARIRLRNRLIAVGAFQSNALLESRLEPHAREHIVPGADASIQAGNFKHEVSLETAFEDAEYERTATWYKVGWENRGHHSLWMKMRYQHPHSPAYGNWRLSAGHEMHAGDHVWCRTAWTFPLEDPRLGWASIRVGYGG